MRNTGSGIVHHDQRRVDRVPAAGLRVLPRDARTASATAQFGDFGAVADVRAELLAECLADAAHAADRLEHGRGLMPAFAELRLELPEICGKDRAQFQRIIAPACLGSAAWRFGIAGAAGTLVGEVAIERAEGTQERADALLIVGADRLRQRFMVHRLRRQLGNIAADVVDHLAVALRPAVERGIVVQQRAAIVVAHDFERHAKLAAVGQDALVMVRQAGGSRIEIRDARRRPSARAARCRLHGFRRRRAATSCGRRAAGEPPESVGA